MAQTFNDLAAFMRSHASDPLYLAKALTAWEWTSWHASRLPDGSLPAPTANNLHNLDAALHGLCGFRSSLMRELFKEIGIEGRRVNFYDVPVQSSHTASEFFINGKWMFFDATFGIYFVSKGGGLPLSIEEARAQWPNVTVMSCTLPGWTGNPADPEAINVARAFVPNSELFFANPALPDRTDDFTAQLSSLYFGPSVTVFRNGVETSLPGGRTRLYEDHNNSYDWASRIYFFAPNKALDLQVVRYDDGSIKVIDADQANSHGWKQKVTVLDAPTSSQDLASAWSQCDYSYTTLDDGSQSVSDFDQRNEFDWSTQEVSYARNGKLAYREMAYDDGSRAVEDLDAMNFTDLNTRKVTHGADGTVLTSMLTYDDGRVATIDWAAANQIDGTSASETLTGGADHDYIRGGSGNDSLVGAASADHMEGGAGNDAYYVDDAGDTVVEAVGSGIDTVNAGVSYALPDNVENLYLLPGAFRGAGNAGNNYIVGSAEANRLDGLGGNDTMLGGGGNDTLVGGDGRDQLEGGPGIDTLFGNAGGDTFLWRALSDTGLTSSSSDVVMDFSFANGDRLHLALIDAVGGGGDQAFSFIGTAAFTGPGQIRYLHGGGETRLLFNTDSDSSAEGIIRLHGLYTPDKAWFVL
jgi:hypothetical protein